MLETLNPEKIQILKAVVESSITSAKGRTLSLYIDADIFIRLN